MDIKKVIAEVRRLATKYPNTVYQSTPVGKCYYTMGNTEYCSAQGCIIGQAIINIYPDLKEFFILIDNLNKNGSLDFTTISALTPLLFGIFDSENKESLWLLRVQNKQDNQHTWSKAVESADKDYPLT